MIIENRTTEVGDVIYIVADVAIIGLIALYSYVDDVYGETVNRSFKKSFRYSVDGVNWSAFTDLNDANLSLVSVQANDTFYAEYLYERIGSDTSGELEFNSVTLNGEIDPAPNGPVYTGSIFDPYFDLNNNCSIAWSVNVLEKLYKKGIIPNFIERNESGNNADDRDYLDFFRAITHYFALYVCLARQFQFFYQNPNLLLEFIKQKGLLVCEDTSVSDLIYLMQNFYDEIRQRGTRQVFEPKASDISVSGSKQVDGEYLRLICYDVRDEFIRNLNKNEHIGWNIGNSSPMFKGLTGRLGTNKYYYDYEADISNIQAQLSITEDSYPFISLYDDSNSNSNSNSVSVSVSVSGGSDEDAIIIKNPGSGNSAGIGGWNSRIVINPNIDYEITFFIKASGLTSNQQFTFGVNAFDKDDNSKTLERNDDNTASNNFFTAVTLNRSQKYYFVRGILFNKNNYKVYDSSKSYKTDIIVKHSGNVYKAKRNVPANGTIVNDVVINSVPGYTGLNSSLYWDYWQLLTTSEIQGSYTTSLGIGNNLILEDDIVKIDPYITYENNGGSTGNLYIHSIRVNPLSTPYSKGFIQSVNLLEIWDVNNNAAYSEDKINKETKHLLIPYNVVLQNNFIPTEINK